MFVIYIEPHTTGFCPERTDQTSADLLPAVVALSAVLVVVILLLAAVIFTIILLYTSESNVKGSCMRAVHVCARVPLRECHYLITDGCA